MMFNLRILWRTVSGFSYSLVQIVDVCVWVGWCGRPNLNPRGRSSLLVVVGQLVRAPKFEPWFLD